MISISHINHLHTSSSQAPQVRAVPAITQADSSDDSEENTNEPTNPVSATEISKRPGSSTELTEAEKQQVQQLKQRDRQVRAHEQAHAAAAGSLANGAPSYEYQRGPDGRQYAVGGSVSIDTSPVSGDPQATLLKAQQIQRAALAPAEPSAQDRAIAADAAAMAAEARAELAKQKSENPESTSNDANLDSGNAIEGESDISTHFCAECGGQHASGSHGVSMQLQNAFAEPKPGLSVFDVAA